MRALIEEEKPPRDLWDLKLVPGGLIDLEFIAQVAVLTHQLEGEGKATGTATVLSRLAPGFADAQMKQELSDAFGLYLTLTQIMRLCLTGHFEREDIPPGLSDLLLTAHRPAGYRRAGGASDGDGGRGFAAISSGCWAARPTKA